MSKSRKHGAAIWSDWFSSSLARSRLIYSFLEVTRSGHWRQGTRARTEKGPRSCAKSGLCPPPFHRPLSFRHSIRAAARTVGHTLAAAHIAGCNPAALGVGHTAGYNLAVLEEGHTVGYIHGAVEERRTRRVRGPDHNSPAAAAGAWRPRGGRRVASQGSTPRQ